MNHSFDYQKLKRAIDVAVSAGVLATCSPLFLTIAVLVKLDSDGPAFFGHPRVGQNNTVFKTLKFRTMVQNAQKVGAQITSSGDSRITRVGKWLRKSKLDELPQFINVLKGEMSLVGPRPEVSKYVEMFREDYQRVLAVRPGITDEAAIVYRNEEEVLAAADDPLKEYVENVLPKKIELYKRYVDNPSLAKDLSILGRTFLAIIKG